jgi:hypothetical protein
MIWKIHHFFSEVFFWTRFSLGDVFSHAEMIVNGSIGHPPMPQHGAPMENWGPCVLKGSRDAGSYPTLLEKLKICQTNARFHPGSCQESILFARMVRMVVVDVLHEFNGIEPAWHRTQIPKKRLRLATAGFLIRPLFRKKLQSFPAAHPLWHVALENPPFRNWMSEPPFLGDVPAIFDHGGDPGIKKNFCHDKRRSCSLLQTAWRVNLILKKNFVSP